jgi:ABC-type spermidine/putrescine transport system permease subunit I
LQILEAQNLPLGAAMAVVLIIALLVTGAVAALALLILKWMNRQLRGASI